MGVGVRVLVNGTCQDPTAGLTVDLEEAPEPNGLDAGSHSAGTIALKPIGDANGFVVHGCVKPVTDEADLDAYTISVAGPSHDSTSQGPQISLSGRLPAPAGVTGSLSGSSVTWRKEPGAQSGVYSGR